MCFYVQKKESRKTSEGSQNQLGRPSAAKSHIARDRFYPILVRDTFNAPDDKGNRSERGI